MSERELNDALCGVSETIRALWEQADADEVATRYKIGALVSKVRDEKGTYGEKGVEQLAATLKKHRGTLYRYAAVADLAPWRELRSKTTAKGRDGFSGALGVIHPSSGS